MQLAGLTVEDVKANIRDAEARAEAALAEYEAAKSELAWWQEGLRLIDPKAASALEAGRQHEAMVADLFPRGFMFENDARPTLRQAIVLVMLQHPSLAWSISDLAIALQSRGWLPTREDATKRISDMAGNMFSAGQLSRLDRGIYKLSPPLAAALEAAGGGQE